MVIFWDGNAFFSSWREKAEVTVALLPFQITGEVWIVLAQFAIFHLKFNKRYKF